jgi:hypothetical protein
MADRLWWAKPKKIKRKKEYEDQTNNTETKNNNELKTKTGREIDEYVKDICDNILSEITSKFKNENKDKKFIDISKVTFTNFTKDISSTDASALADDNDTKKRFRNSNLIKTMFYEINNERDGDQAIKGEFIEKIRLSKNLFNFDFSSNEVSNERRKGKDITKRIKDKVIALDIKRNTEDLSHNKKIQLTFDDLSGTRGAGDDDFDKMYDLKQESIYIPLDDEDFFEYKDKADKFHVFFRDLSNTLYKSYDTQSDPSFNIKTESDSGKIMLDGEEKIIDGLVFIMGSVVITNEYSDTFADGRTVVIELFGNPDAIEGDGWVVGDTLKAVIRPP